MSYTASGQRGYNSGMTVSRLLIAVGAALLAVATGLGAWASHGAEAVLGPAALRTFETGVDYQAVHSLGLLAVGIFGERIRGRKLAIVGSLLTVGILFFCGGVYASGLGGPGWITSLAPVGGISLIVGWFALAVAVILDRNADRVP